MVLLTGKAIHLLELAPSLQIPTKNGDHLIGYADFLTAFRHAVQLGPAAAAVGVRDWVFNPAQRLSALTDFVIERLQEIDDIRERMHDQLPMLVHEVIRDGLANGYLTEDDVTLDERDFISKLRRCSHAA